MNHKLLKKMTFRLGPIYAHNTLGIISLLFIKSLTRTNDVYENCERESDCNFVVIILESFL